MAIAERDGLRLFYEQKGDGEPPIVFVHGWCCDHTYFQPQVDHFAAAHAVTALDLRGFGQSDRPPAGYDVQTFSDDVAWLCDELGIVRPIIVGHSLGGWIAIDVGARFPDLASGIVAVDPGPISPPAEVVETLKGLIAQMQGPDAEAVRRAFIEDFLFISADDAERKQRIVEQMCSVPVDLAASILGNTIATWDAAEALKSCHAPTLILLAQVGIDDPARLLALKPDLHVGVTVGAGHFHQLEIPEQVTPMIERFMHVAVPSAVVP